MSLLRKGAISPAKSPRDPNLILELLFSEGAGTIAHDGSRYRNNGTIYGACLTENQLIYTPNGVIPISDVKSGMKVFVFDGSVKVKHVKAKIFSGIKQVYALRTRNELIEATGNHPFLLARWRGQDKISGYRKCHPYCYQQGIWELVWTELKNLKVGDAIIALHHLPREQTSTINEDFMRFVGCLLGDGYVLIRERKGRNEGRIGLCLEKPSEQEKYSQILNKLGVNHSVKQKQILIYNKELAYKLKELELAQGVHQKFIPKWVWNLPKPHIRALIEGLVDSDGWNIKQTPNNLTFAIALSNENLTKQARGLCHYIGLKTSNINFRRREKRKLDGRTLPEHDEWSFQIYPNRQRKREPRAIVYGKNRRINILLPDEFDFQKITEIEPLGERPVYDISIYGIHNFISEGLVVHNSWVDGKIGKALSFGGVSSYVEILDSASLDVTSSLTLALWEKLSAVVDVSLLIDKYYGVGVGSYSAYILTTGELRVRVNTTGGVIAFDSISNILSTINVWNHIVLTYDGSVAKIYLNGRLDNTLALVGTIVTSTKKVRLGRALDDSWQLNGILDEVRLYNRALSADEIKRWYDSTK